MTVRNAVRAATTIVSLSTFVLLYFGLVDLARLAGMHDARAWLYPLAVDGMVAAAYASTLDARLGRSGLRYAWAVVVTGSGMSLLGQWLHAQATSSWAFAGPVAAAPALCMALVWHLLFLVTTRPAPAVEAPPQVSAPAAPRAVRPAPVKRTPAPRTPARTPDKLTAARAAMSAAMSAGETMTGARMAAALGLPDTPSGHRAGRRYLAQATA